jgi:hypothetical protein
VPEHFARCPFVIQTKSSPYPSELGAGIRKTNRDVSKDRLNHNPRKRNVMNEKNTNRTRVVTFRLTTREYEKIEASFKTTTCRKLSDYMRYVLLEKKLTVFTRNKSMDDFMAELILLRNELNAIGNNYNQVVKRLHLLQTIPEFKTWLFINESAKENLVKKVDEIKLRINQFSDKWSQE